MLVTWDAITPIMTSPKWETQIMSHMVAIAGITNLVLSHSHQVTTPHLKVGNRCKKSKLPTKPMDQARDNISHKMVVFAWITAVQHYFHKKTTWYIVLSRCGSLSNMIMCVVQMEIKIKQCIWIKRYNTKVVPLSLGHLSAWCRPRQHAIW